MALLGGLGKIFNNVGFLVGEKLVDLTAKNAKREIFRNELKGVLIML